MRAGTQFLEFQHADLVGARLARVDDVAFYLGGNILFAHAGFLQHVGNGLLSRPLFGVNAGIDDKTHSAE